MELAPGARVGPTAWRRVTQEDIDTFARLSGDGQWIHIDAERARRESPFGTTIAHGNLTLALIDGFRDELVGAAPEGVRLGVNLGYDRVRFPAPVPAGAEVRATMELVSADPRPDGWLQLVQRFTVEVRGADRPACVADSVVRVLPDAPRPAPSTRSAS
jgi:acyl dehydratase